MERLRGLAGGKLQGTVWMEEVAGTLENGLRNDGVIFAGVVDPRTIRARCLCPIRGLGGNLQSWYWRSVDVASRKTSWH
eukprot:2806477-Pyramimonas_sp.AAC.2